MRTFSRWTNWLVLYVGAAIALAGNVQASEPTVVRDENGSPQYMVYLDEEMAELERAGDEPPARATMDPLNEKDFYGWHKPNVRALVRRLERTYGVKAVTMTSYTLPTFTAFLNAEQEARMRGESAVEKMEVVLQYPSTYSWGDLSSGSETIPWGKQAIGTNDAITTTNRVYMIDGELAVSPSHADLSFITAPVNSGQVGSREHGTHVAGILSAAANNSGVRGINPGSTVINVRSGTTAPYFSAAFDWVLADSEASGKYAVANFSSNTGDFWEQSGSNINGFVRRLSARVLFVQSAGNNLSGGCTTSYGAAPAGSGIPRQNNQDGILVVGGIGKLGEEGKPFNNTHIGWGSQPGSNFGNCVETWAPSQDVWSTWYLPASPTATQYLSGTSMAAPHVTALAARYGGNNTTPVEREFWIRSKLFYTGYLSSSGQNITVPSYLQSPTGAMSRLFPVGVTADATLAGSSTAAMSDSLYLSGLWNSGHLAPAWVEFDLGSSKVITSIRATPEQFPAGAVVHQIYAGNTPAPTSLITTLSGPGANMEPMATAVGTYARYIRIYTVTSPSWVAWREVEIYGY